MPASTDLKNAALASRFGGGALVTCAALIAAVPAWPQDPTEPTAELATAAPEDDVAREAELESAFSRMLSGATLEGSFTNTAPGRDPTQLSREKYTLGEVRNLGGNLWLFPTRIQYGEHDVTLPITLPVRWAGDTPLVVVDNVGLPGFGTVSARVMFFDGHYAGYWKHGKQGGHLFGTVRPAEAEGSEPHPETSERSGLDEPTREQEEQ